MADSLTHDRPCTEDLDCAGFKNLTEVVDGDTVCGLINAIEKPEVNARSHQGNKEPYAIRNLLTLPTVKALAASAPIRQIVEAILGAEALAVRGLLFNKTPAANWKVTWHQDLTIAVRQRREVPGYGAWSIKAGVEHVQPPAAVLEKMITMRLHLDDCGEHNGPLQVLPGSHRAGKLSAKDIQDWRKKVPAVNCLAKRGDVLLLRPLLLHASSKAVEAGHRRVIHLEFAAGKLDGGLDWIR